MTGGLRDIFFIIFVSIYYSHSSIEIFYSIEVCGWVFFSWKWIPIQNSFDILSKQSNRKCYQRLFLNCFLSIDIWALFTPSAHISKIREQRKTTLFLISRFRQIASKFMRNVEFIHRKYLQSKHQVERHRGGAAGERHLYPECESCG